MRLFSEATIEQAKEKIESTQWAKAGWQTVQTRVAMWQEQLAQIPAEAGGWIHNYICPQHWHPLIFDGNLPDQHGCPEGHVCTGEKFDAAWRVWRHRQLADWAREAALAFVVLDLEAGREMARSILTQYADFYTQFDGQSDAESWMLKGHAFNQALTEALWAIPLIHAYDLVADSLSDGERKRFADELWAPLTTVMTRAQDKLIAQNNIKSNYMAWLNVTLGCLGFTLNDSSLIARAIQPPAGFIAHLDKAIFADGLEFECTPYYHNFVLLANLILAEAAKANKIDLYAISGAEGQTLASMGSAFAELAWPDGSIPDIGEGSYWQDSIYDPEVCQSFEILHAASQSSIKKQPEKQFAWTLQTAYERQGVARDNWAALLYGRDDVETAVAPQPCHTVLEESGIAVLRSHKNQKLAVMVPFASYRRHHHQYDRLSLAIWPFSRDAGSPLYGLPVRKDWYSHSYAHNTLVVDEQSHAPCGGELLAWDGQRLSLAAPDAYPDTDFTRTIEMKDGTIFDELVVQSNDTHTFDWLLHLDGDIVLPPDLEPLSGPLTTTGAGTYIDLLGQTPMIEYVSIDIDYESKLYQLTLRGEQPFTLLLGMAPGTSRQPQQPRHVLIARTVGTEQRYRAIITQK